jgi:ABC-type glycerol-3-phosphate transport system substrate-binding protein
MRGSLSRKDFLRLVGAATGGVVAGVFDVPSLLASPPSQDEVNLRAVIINAPRVEAFQDILPAFQEANPNVNVEFIGIPGDDWTNFIQRVSVMLAGGQQLDNVELGLEGFQLFTTNNILVQLDDLVVNDPDMEDYFQDVAPNLIECVMSDGHLYNLAFLWAAPGIYYNRNLFEQAGLERPENDWTHEDFAAAARAISGLGDDIFGYAWPNRQFAGFIVWSYVNATNLLEPIHSPEGGWLWDRFYPDMSEEERANRGGGYTWGMSNAHDANNVEALEFLIELERDGAAFMTSANFGDVIGPFTAGTVGMMPSHRAFIAAFAANGLTPDDYDVVYHPMWKSQTASIGASGLAVLTLSDYQEAAFALLKHITGRDTQATFISGGRHTASRRSVTNAPDQNDGIAPEHWENYYGAVDELESLPFAAPPNNRDYVASMTKWFSLAVAGDMTAQEAMDGFTEEVDALLAES